MGPLGSGPAGAAASPGQGIVVRVYPAPAEYDKPGYLVLKTAGFQQHFVTSIKELPPSETDRRFHPQGKVWLVLTRAWEQVKTHLESRGFTIKAEQSGADGPQGKRPCVRLTVQAETPKRAVIASTKVLEGCNGMHVAFMDAL